jgi:hypothetical protein
MPTTLTSTTVSLAAAAPGPESPLPMFGNGIDLPVPASAGDGGSDLAYGRPASLLPYHAQDGYDRVLKYAEHSALVLENEYLTATFLPGLGGRLWSLRDRRSDRELLHTSAAMPVANLALRNAWFAGGVEWNLGTTGHWPLTYSPVHAARVDAPDGTPVLRLWELERLRGLVWRIDCWLPAGSRLLFVRPRLHNPHRATAPVYWWSNIAVPQHDGVRVLVPADEAMEYGYDGTPRHVPFPRSGATDPDLSYPAALTGAADHFFDLRRTARPWIAAVDRDGVGLVQTSTRRLWGRKIFRWGRGTGGERWQRWLSVDGGYLEIQAGLARTQLEHVPLEPGESWSWTEAYGPVELDRGVAHGPWRRAGEAVADALTDLAAEPPLEMADAAAEAWADVPPTVSLAAGSGWGALETLVGHLPHSPGTPFDESTIGPRQVPWLTLWKTGTLPVSDPPAATVSGPGWESLLGTGLADWHTLLHRGLVRLAAGDRDAARTAWEESVRVSPNAWALRNLGELDRLDGAPALAAERLLAAHRLAPDCQPLTVETLAALVDAGRHADALAVVDRLSGSQRRHGRIRLNECRAAVETGAVDRAGAILEAGLIVPDLREGEDSLASLWARYQDRAGTSRPLPAMYDFRMHDPSG